MSLILGIESAVGGGSLCLTDGGDVVAELAGAGQVSRAEDLLSNIDAVLRKGGVAAKAVRKVAVSTGPGSFTGIRIGIATALGLCKGTGAVCLGVSLFEALAWAGGTGGNVIAALEIRENEAAWQPFRTIDGRRAPMTAPQSGSYAEFAAAMMEMPESCLVADPHFAESCRKIGVLAPEKVVHVPERSFAALLAACVGKGLGGPPEPLYLRQNARAGTL